VAAVAVAAAAVWCTVFKQNDYSAWRNDDFAWKRGQVSGGGWAAPTVGIAARIVAARGVPTRVHL